MTCGRNGANGQCNLQQDGKPCDDGEEDEKGLLQIRFRRHSVWMERIATYDSRRRRVVSREGEEFVERDGVRQMVKRAKGQPKPSLPPNLLSLSSKY